MKTFHKKRRKSKWFYLFFLRFFNVVAFPVSLFLSSTKKNHPDAARKVRVALAIVSRLDLDPVPDLSPSDETPMLLHSPTEGDLLADRGADRRRQPDLGQIGLDGDDAATGGERSDVDHQHLVLGKLRNFRALFVALHSDTEKSTKLKSK